MRELVSDLRFAVRLFAKSPGFAAAAVLALGLGIGANTAIFSVVDAVLLRPLPFHDPDRLVMVSERWNQTLPASDTNPLNFLDWREQNHSFERVAAIFPTPLNLTGGDEPEQVAALQVSADFFPMLGVQPLIGHWFRVDEDRPTGDKPVVLSYGMWREHFGGDTKIMGRAISLNDVTYHVVGVMPRSFDLPQTPADLWIPSELDRAGHQTDGRYLTVIARLRKGISTNQAVADMDNLLAQIKRSRLSFNAQVVGMRVIPLAEEITGKVRLPLYVLLAAVGFVLLIACANVANLLLMRATVRRREIAVRTALGARRWRLVRQLLTESTLLSLGGGALGLGLASWGISALTMLLPADFPLSRANEIHIDGGVLAFTLAVSVLTGLAFGLLPALQISQTDVGESLKQGGLRSGAGAGRALRSALVVSEVAVAVLLLAGAGLLGRSFLHLVEVNPGFQPQHVLTMHMFVSPESHAWGEPVGAYTERVVERIRALPQVDGAGSIHFLPLSGKLSNSGYFRTDRPTPKPADLPNANLSVVTPGFFHAMGIRLIAGREFRVSDRFGGPGAVVVSESFARRAFPNENPIGKKLGIWWTFMEQGEIVGVVGDLNQVAMNAPRDPTIYLSAIQAPNLHASLVIRTSADPKSIARDVVNAIHQVDPNQPVGDIASMDEVVSASVARPRFQTLLVGIFSCLALLLAALGIYSVMAYSATQRGQEFAIRMALGAGAGQLLRTVIGEGLVLAGSGVAIGTGLALILGRMLRNLLFGVPAHDPVTFTGTAIVLMAIATLACWAPARRASRTDPMTALRHE
jgi:putative ABC transport system permease protein